MAYAVCQPGHDPAPKGQEGSEPARYPREVEIANAHLISAAPDLYEAARLFVEEYDAGDDASGVALMLAYNDALTAAKAALAKARGQ